MIASTMGRYLAWNFLRNLLLVYLLFFGLIVIVDLIELSRQLATDKSAAFSDIVKISFLRAPQFAGQILPFAVLFGAIASLLVLNRRLELVIARASGVSVWQFLTPIALAAAVVGLFSSFVYNPLSLEGQRQSRGVEADVFGYTKAAVTSNAKNFWLSVGQIQGEAIIRASVEEDAGKKLTDVTVYLFTPDGIVGRRLDAVEAIFGQNDKGQSIYRLQNVQSTVPGEPSEKVDEVEVVVNITEQELLANVTEAKDISFWGLKKQAERAFLAGRNHLPFISRFHALLAQPLLFVAMVLVAASVSLRFARFGLNGKAILGGVLAGFVLYVVSELVLTFGNNGLVSPFMAAWSPAFVATLMGVTVLLHREDG